MKAVIPCAGMSLGFLPATKAQPKEMLPIGDKPIIQFVVEELISSGEVDDILLITSHSKRAIEDHFDRDHDLEHAFRKMVDHPASSIYEDLLRLSDKAKIHFKRQGHMGGTGGAIHSARKHVGEEPFLVVFGDTIFQSIGPTPPVSKQMVDTFKRFDTNVIAIEQQPTDKLETYGVIKEHAYSGDHRIHIIDDLVEKPKASEAPSNLVIAGMFVLMPEIFDAIERTPPRDKALNNIPITGALKVMADDWKREVPPLMAYEFSGRRFDIDTKQDWYNAIIDFVAKR